MHLNDDCSRYINFTMLFHCGETWQRLQCDNQPQREESWDAYRQLAKHVLDPLVEQMGLPQLTFGFCGPALRKAILAKENPGIAPALDQHAACEQNKNGKLICTRQGAAVDLFYPGHSSIDVALWLACHTPYDRLYLYGADRPLHISYGPQHSRAITQLLTYQGRRLPRRLSLTALQGVRDVNPGALY